MKQQAKTFPSRCFLPGDRHQGFFSDENSTVFISQGTALSWIWTTNFMVLSQAEAFILSRLLHAHCRFPQIKWQSERHKSNFYIF